MTIRRFQDWPLRLESYLRSRVHTPFKWGVHDCCTFADGAVEAMRGMSVLQRCIDPYADEIGAIRGMLKLGSTLDEAVVQAFQLAELNVEEISPTRAQRGDVLIVYSGQFGLRGMAVAIVGVDGRPVGVGEVGWVTLSYGNALRAWRI